MITCGNHDVSLPVAFSYLVFLFHPLPFRLSLLLTLSFLRHLSLELRWQYTAYILIWGDVWWPPIPWLDNVTESLVIPYWSPSAHAGTMSTNSPDLLPHKSSRSHTESFSILTLTQHGCNTNLIVRGHFMLNLDSSNIITNDYWIMNKTNGGLERMEIRFVCNKKTMSKITFLHEAGSKYLVNLICQLICTSQVQWFTEFSCNPLITLTL